MYTILNDINLIPVLRKVPYEKSEEVIRALIDGGIRAIEITLDTVKAIEMIQQAKEQFGHQVLVGAGTVLTVSQCEEAIQAGAQFIVSPSLNLEVVKYALSANIPVIPGVFTPSEMQTAYAAGAETVKLFPASSLGPKFIKDVKGPLAHIQIMTTGGISIETAKSYLEAGAMAVGAGSDLLKKEWIQKNEWVLLAKEVKAWLEVIK
ncbi:bifunctional 4-hydroxy-2-oxoglutarate aldolase/2-dehydro-3-deoxy-phosphogluconate aldolase [Solibacillus sp. FSL K6-1523]|uniref:bifunctional 4-hydroxy-2-oxoglutarate aldolase/2-dehydro-3-deoxy-phosphogluconate aldolase n=1 Tax=Solibacillus sp. FSL K6-1523 TaxID=2921471 RepID=UPI0030F67A14